MMRMVVVLAESRLEGYMDRRKAFTLIELLVVIAIIGWYPQMTGVFGQGWSILMADANGL